MEKYEAFFSDRDDENATKYMEMLLTSKGQEDRLKNRSVNNFYRCLKIYFMEKEAGSTSFFDNVNSFEEMNRKVCETVFLIYRVAADNLNDETIERFLRIKEQVSAYAMASFISELNDCREETVLLMYELYMAAEDKANAIRMLASSQKLNEKSETIARKLVGVYLEMGLLNEAKSVIANSVLKDKEEFKSVM